MWDVTIPSTPNFNGDVAKPRGILQIYEKLYTIENDSCN